MYCCLERADRFSPHTDSIYEVLLFQEEKDEDSTLSLNPCLPGTKTSLKYFGAQTPKQALTVILTCCLWFRNSTTHLHRHTFLHRVRKYPRSSITHSLIHRLFIAKTININNSGTENICFSFLLLRQKGRPKHLKSALVPFSPPCYLI